MTEIDLINYQIIILINGELYIILITGTSEDQLLSYKTHYIH